MSVTTTFGKDSAGRVDFIKLSMRGKSPVEVRYFYTGDAVTVEVKGDKRFLPSIPEFIAMIDAKFIGRIDQIALVDLISRIVLIDTIAAITNIANINSVDLIDRITLLDRITLIDAITNIGTLANLTNVGTVNLINTIAAITNIASLDLVDRITLIDAITNIGTIGTITTLTGITNPINVKTSGATNIVLDLLTQGAYTERRSTLINDVGGAFRAPLSAGFLWAKFFPRGCRGFIDSIDVICNDVGVTGGNITICLSPCVAGGVVYSSQIAVPAGGGKALRPAVFNVMWNYDSMFIWAYSSNAELGVYYDTSVPYDWFQSLDSGATWASAPNRGCFRVNLSGETCGDVPVSGIVNNIEIPNLSAARQFQTLAVPAASELMDTIQYGSGKLLIAIFHYYGGTAGLSVLFPRIKCDGVQILPLNNSFSIWQTRYVTATSQGIFIGVWDVINDFYTIIVVLKYPFKRSLEVGFFNDDAGTAYTGYVAYSYEKIS